MEVSRAAPKQKNDEISEWIEESEPEPEEVEIAEPCAAGQEQRHLGDSFGAAGNSTRGNRGQLGRGNSRESRYQNVGQRGRVSQRVSLHRLLPDKWGQGKRQCAINRYKKDLRQAEEELQQLHFREQPQGEEDGGKPGDRKAESSEEDNMVWQSTLTPTTSATNYDLGKAATTPPSPGRTHYSFPLGTSTLGPLTKSLSPLSPTPTFSLSSALKRKLPLRDPPPSLMKSVYFVGETGNFRGNETSMLSGGHTKARTPEGRKFRLLVNSLGHVTNVPTIAQLKAATAREPWEQDAEQPKLRLLQQGETTLW